MSDEMLIGEIEPVRPGLVNGGGSAADHVAVFGSKCKHCGEVSIGTNDGCLNCGGSEIQRVTLANEGTLWTYTIIRHKPPGDYLGPDPFEPYALGLVELPDGIRVMAPLVGDVDKFEIGSVVRSVPWVLVSDDGKAYRAFRYAPVKEGV